MLFIRSAIVLCFLLCASPVQAQGMIWEEHATNIQISVKAKDALFIGTSTGGAHISVINKLTGDIIADGITYGSSGDKDIIMKDNVARDEIITDDNSAKFSFSLDLMSPTLVTIVAKAPLSQKQSLVEVSQDYLLIPGKDYTSGNGIILELPGIIVDTLSPSAASKSKFDPDAPITLIANVKKLCGCDISTDGLWPANRYEVEAHIYKGAAYISTIPLQLNDNSHFAARLKMPEPGIYRILITAYDPQTKEGGVDETTIILTAKK